MALTMVNRNAEVIVVGQIDTLINFCPNMVRFRIRLDLFGRFFFLFFYFCILVFDLFLLLSLLLYKLNLKQCGYLFLFIFFEICLFLMLSNEI